MSTVNEQGQTNLAQRTKLRKDTYRLSASTALTEVDDGKLISIEIGATPIVLTLASAVRCVGCTIEGVVAVSGGQSSLTITGSILGQLSFTGSPNLTSSANTLFGAPLVLANAVLGTRFRAVSTGLRWNITVHNPAARPFLGVRAVTASTAITAADTNSILPITINGPTVLTLPNASTMPGAVVRGVIVSNAGSSTCSLTCTTVAQIVANTVIRPSTGTPGLADVVKAFVGVAVDLGTPAVGTSFEAVSTGTQWSIKASGVAAF